MCVSAAWNGGGTEGDKEVEKGRNSRDGECRVAGVGGVGRSRSP